MALNVGQMLGESAEALGVEEPNAGSAWIEKWLPEIVNEIEHLRNQVVLQDVRITELESEVDHLGGS